MAVYKKTIRYEENKEKTSRETEEEVEGKDEEEEKSRRPTIQNSITNYM